MASHHPLEEVLNCPKALQHHHHHHQEAHFQFQFQQQQPQQHEQRKPRPHPDQALKCPRCDSTNTKFCYYNNYSLSQPRYFCKGCRRYWTQGGSLRNVPVGGGCRKNKRPLSSSPATPAAAAGTGDGGSAAGPSKKLQDEAAMAPESTLGFLPVASSLLTTLLPPPSALGYDHGDLLLALARLQKPVPPVDHDALVLGNPGSVAASGHGFLDILKAGLAGAAPAAGFHSSYYGFGNVGRAGVDIGDTAMVVVPFDDGCGGAVAAGSSKDGEPAVRPAAAGCDTTGDGNNEYNGSGNDDDELATGSQLQQIGGTSWHGMINS